MKPSPFLHGADRGALITAKIGPANFLATRRAMATSLGYESAQE